jgi:hypothetical protein
MSRSRGKEGVEGAEGLGQIKGETGRWGDRWEMGRRTDGEGDGQTARWGDVGRVEGDEIGKEKEIDIEEDTMAKDRSESQRDMSSRPRCRGGRRDGRKGREEYFVRHPSIGRADPQDGRRKN